MSNYVVWNTDFHQFEGEAETYKELLDQEERLKGCCSSIIATTDIESVVDAFVSEADVTLGYHKIEHFLTKDEGFSMTRVKGQEILEEVTCDEAYDVNYLAKRIKKLEDALVEIYDHPSNIIGVVDLAYNALQHD